MSTKISVFGLAKLTNANHVDFHHKFYQYFTATTAAKLNVNAKTATAYQQSQLVEQDIVKRQSGSALSPQLEAKDKQRDQVLYYVFNIYYLAEKAPFAAQREAFAALKPVMKPYQAIYNHAYAQEDAEIIGLLKDLRADNLKAHIEILGLTPVLNKLEELNKEFIALNNQRTSEIPPATDTKAARAETDRLYSEIVDKANATVQLQTNPEAEKFVTDINNLISETQNTYNVQMGMLSANKKKAEEAEKAEAAALGITVEELRKRKEAEKKKSSSKSSKVVADQVNIDTGSKPDEKPGDL
jgi:cobalamin biosynthesis Mg chelatase CobN